VGWRYAVAALEAGTLTGGSGSDNRVLRIAASLSELGVAVDLADAVRAWTATTLPWCWPRCVVA